MTILFKSNKEILNGNLKVLLSSLLNEGVIDDVKFRKFSTDSVILNKEFFSELLPILEKFYIDFEKRNEYFLNIVNMSSIIERLRNINYNKYKYIYLPKTSNSSSKETDSTNFRMEIDKISYSMRKQRTDTFHKYDNLDQQIEFDNEIIQRLQYPKMKIAIIGKSGVGKTTQYRQLTYFWACKLWGYNTNKILLNISLTNQINCLDDIYDLILRQNFMNFPLLTKNFIKLLFWCKSSSIILFIDNFDFMINKKILFENFKIKIQTNISCVIWSRDFGDIRKINIDYDVYELLGLDSDQLFKFLLRCYKKENSIISSFMQHLPNSIQESSTMLNMSKSFLSPIIGFYMYEIFRDEKNLPLIRTEYDIYDKKIKSILKNKLWLETDISIKFCQACLINLAKQAFQLELSDVFFENIEYNIGEIISIFNVKNSFSSFIKFEDKKFQEYFAANYIVRNSINSVINGCLDKVLMKIPKRNFNCVMKFTEIIYPLTFKIIILHSNIFYNNYYINEEFKKMVISKNFTDTIDLTKIKLYEFFIKQIILNKNNFVKNLKISLDDFHFEFLIDFAVKNLSNLDNLYIDASNRYIPCKLMKYIKKLLFFVQKRKFLKVHINDVRFYWQYRIFNLELKVFNTLITYEFPELSKRFFETIYLSPSFSDFDIFNDLLHILKNEKNERLFIRNYEFDEFFTKFYQQKSERIFLENCSFRDINYLLKFLESQRNLISLKIHENNTTKAECHELFEYLKTSKYDFIINKFFQISRVLEALYISKSTLTTIKFTHNFLNEDIIFDFHELSNITDIEEIIIYPKQSPMEPSLEPKKFSSWRYALTNKLFDLKTIDKISIIIFPKNIFKYKTIQLRLKIIFKISSKYKLYLRKISFEKLKKSIKTLAVDIPQGFGK